MIEEIRFYLQESPDRMLGLGFLGVFCLVLIAMPLTRGLRRRMAERVDESSIVRGMGRWTSSNPDTIALGAGVLCVLATAALLVNPVRLLARGVSADGVVTKVVERMENDAHGNSSIRSTATIRFQAGERDMTIERSTSREAGSTCVAGCYVRGERLKILYLAEDPSSAAVRSFPGLFSAPFVPAVAGALAFLFFWLMRRERAKRADGITPPS